MSHSKYIPLSRPVITKEILSSVYETLQSGWWSTGPKVAEFESALSNYLMKKDMLYSVGLNSCTSALHLALLAFGIGRGDEVIVPTWTFVSTAHVVEWVGAKVVLCDIESDSLNIDVEKAEKLINSNTKAIIPVHIAGYPCDIDGIMRLAEKNNLKVIEDAAHAIGSEYNGTKIGNHSDVACFSFYATKNLAMGEGGAAVSRDQSLIEKMRKLGYFGIDKEAFKRYDKSGTWRYDVEGIGYKYNLDSLHAAIGIEQLKVLNQLNERRRGIAAIYKKGLKDSVSFTRDTGNHYHIFHLFPIILPENTDRDDFIDTLKDNNIGTGVHFVPLHLHSYYSRYNDGSFVEADKIFPRIVSIPMYPDMTNEDVFYVINSINEYFKEKI